MCRISGKFEAGIVWVEDMEEVSARRARLVAGKSGSKVVGMVGVTGWKGGVPVRAGRLVAWSPGPF
jgi:hypothetical protein